MKFVEKLSSRKFQILLVWLFFSCVALFNKDLAAETKNIIIQFTGSISIVYIGGNVYQKKILSDKTIEK